MCHFDVTKPDPAGGLVIEGLPEAFTPGERYLLTVALRRPGMERGGFELAARYADGEKQGTQAGELRATNPRAAVSNHKEIDYAHHTVKGTDLSAADAATWQIEWTAPAQPAGPVVFHTAGNAGNGDDSQFGDHIYAASTAVPGVTDSPSAETQSSRTPDPRR